MLSVQIKKIEKRVQNGENNAETAGPFRSGPVHNEAVGRLEEILQIQSRPDASHKL